MKWFHSTQGKLIGLFGGVGLALGLVVALCLVALARTGQDLEVVTTKDMGEISNLASLEAGANASAIILRDLGLNEDMKIQASLLDELKKIDADFEVAIEAIKSQAEARGGADVQWFERLQAQATEVKNARNIVLTAIDEARFDDLKMLLVDKYRPSQIALASTLRERSVERALAARESANVTNQWISKMRWGLSLTLGVVLVAGAVMIGIFVRRLMRTLGGEPSSVATCLSQIAGGDLSGQVEVGAGDTGSVMAALVGMQASLAAMVKSVRSNAESVAVASDEISQGNSDLSSRTEQQASALQETAASMENLSATVKSTADNARHAGSLAANATKVASEGGKAVNEVVSTMREINLSASRIAEITSVIDGIAFQTNILALNAAVEAARAGEHGRGFAVVASEVRSLATRSGDAAREIKGLIASSMERVERGSSLVNQAGETMGRIVNAIRDVDKLIQDISGASGSQSATVGEVGSAVRQIDQSTQQNAALVEQGAAASLSLKQQASQLVAAVSVFKV